MMQWKISELLWQHIRNSDTVAIEVSWSEWLLQQQIHPDEFRHDTVTYHQALKNRIGDRLTWQFEATSHQPFHRVRIHKQ